LNQVDEVATGVLKQDGGQRPHVRWLTTEADTKLFEAPSWSSTITLASLICM
jgi:hypothetical protein